MERDEDYTISENSQTNRHFNDEPFFTTSNFFIDRVGEVILSLNSTELSWKPADSLDYQEESSYFGLKFCPGSAGGVKLSDIYAVELPGLGPIRQMNGDFFMHQDQEMYRFTVYAMQRSKTKPSLWELAEYTFGHRDQVVCQMLGDQINVLLKRTGRPKSLLVFVNPVSGKGNGQKIWGIVAPIFSRANVRAQVTVTKRAGHAFDVVASMANRELNSYDGIVAVGGDGLFSEILNGLLRSRMKTVCPPLPPDFLTSPGEELGAAISGQNETTAADEDVEFSMPHKWFRFGIIPAGSTDAIVICTTGTRDPVTSALHIVLGKRVGLDIAQVVSWKATNSSKVEPCIHYTASFVGYGFYGDVITESEKYRWMGPKRYDFAGTKVFLEHRSYEAEVAYLDVNSDETTSDFDDDALHCSCWGRRTNCERVICRVNCEICKPCSSTGESRWFTSKGRFLSVGAAVISCRNERAPDGLVVDAHLSDGFLHLILIRNCSHALYLWHLTHLARKGGSPLDFNFVEHHKTTAFAFTSYGKEGVWNLDGEILQAHKLSAHVLPGLISLFATGPEV